MSSRIKRVIKMLILCFVNTCLCGTHFWKIKRSLLSMAGVQIGTGTKIVGPLRIGNVATLKIGNDCWIGHSFSIEGNGDVVIADNCDIAPDVSILTGSHEIGDRSRRAGKGVSFSVMIGNGCWLGARSTITGNIKIEDGSVVAACAFVNKCVDKDTVVAGVPAKTIRTLSE